MIKLEDKKNSADINEQIKETSPPGIATNEIAKREGEVDKSTSKIPVIEMDDITKRKEWLINQLKKRKEWLYWIVFSFITFIGLYIRTRNIPKLKDITTGTWTLGPDLDPFLFLRWARYIAEHGKLFLLDNMRYVPLAEICSGKECNPVNTAGEMNLLSYLMAWLYKFLSFFNSEITITYSSIIFPVIMFGLTTIAFFLFAKKIFYKEDKKTRNIIALVSTAFFVLVPSLLPRTIAGIPEKESAAFLFIFLSFYFFLESFTSEKLKKGLIFSTLAGISTGLLALIWGGVTYVFVTIAGAVLFAFLLGKTNRNILLFYSVWILGFLAFMLPLSTRYSWISLIASTSTGLVFIVFFILLMDFILFNINVFDFGKKVKINLPKQIISLFIAGILLIILSSIFFGVSFVPTQIADVISQTVHPLTQNRFGVTVAENKQPYFVSDWKGNFGPAVWNIPLFFWLFFVGSVFLFNYMMKPLRKKEKIFLIFSYFIFLICLIFSKYAPHPNLLDGEGNLSLIVYFGGILLLLLVFGYFYLKRYKEKIFSNFKEFEFSYILYFIIFTTGIVSARGAVRLIMVLGAISPIAIGFLIVSISKRYLKEKEETKKLLFGIIALAIIFASVFTLWTYYKDDKTIAENYSPGAYQWQWQKAMAWVRENTQENAVFAHWWDYGYWLQSIGERATILDGGNAVGYWNHLMGRHVLTGENEATALNFLYAHNSTHLLIDSTDIGKYTAFSSIGSNEDYDRFSWIQTFLIDDSQTQETNNKTIYVYQGGSLVDEDISWKDEEKEIFLPRKNAIVGGVMIEMSSDKNRISQPVAVIIYNGKQVQIPLRFAYAKGEWYDFESGLEAGVFLFPKLESSGTGIGVNEIGAMLYLGQRTIHSQLARLYLFNEKSDYLKLVHTENNLFIEDLKNQGMNIGEIVYYHEVQGPIKIWEINYPENITLKKEYLNREYPKEFQTVKTGEY